MTDFLVNFVHIYIHYFLDLWWTLAVGFILSGFFYVYIPNNFIERYLGREGIIPILAASCAGVLLPICCIGVLPIAKTFRKQGARLGPVLAFLVTTPATSISALILCLQLLGLLFTVYIFFAVIIMGLVMGIITDGIEVASYSKSTQEPCCQKDSCCEDKELKGSKFKRMLKYSFITMPKEIGREILIGIAVASFIMAYPPINTLIKQYAEGLFGYLIIIAVGLVSYVCSTASVPLADALIKSGFTYGQAMCYLIVGPIASYTTLMVIKKEFGMHVLIVYLSIICSLTLIVGIAFDAFFVQP